MVITRKGITTTIERARSLGSLKMPTLRMRTSPASVMSGSTPPKPMPVRTCWMPLRAWKSMKTVSQKIAPRS